MLRGINVSGHKKVPMPDLKALYEGLSFRDVITYIQSGNVIFKADISISPVELAGRIEKSIIEKFGFDVPVIIRTMDEIKNVVALNPFLKESGIDIDKLHVTFLEEKPQSSKISAIEDLDFSPDKFFIIEREIYLYCPNGYGNTKLSNTYFENKLKMQATTRNWKTVNKLAELANS